MLSELDWRLQNFHLLCQKKEVWYIEELQNAPKDILGMLDDMTLWPKIKWYLTWRGRHTVKTHGPKVQIYADDEELKIMEVCHARSI